MSKKSKSSKRKQKDTTSPTTKLEKAVRKKRTWYETFQSPVLSSHHYYGFVSWAGYGIGVLILLVLIAHHAAGYLLRPTVLDESLIQKVLHPENYGNPKIGKINPTIKFYRGLSEDTETLLFQLKEGEIAGFYIESGALNLPPRNRSFGIAMITYYQGEPLIRYGFAKKNHSMKQILRELRCVSLEMYPNLDEMRGMSTIPAYNSPTNFAVPWDQSDYFYFVIAAKSQTTFHLEKVIFLME